MISFENLNENQCQAVEWSGGPLLVLAGPGSGKTGVLTLRVARLLEEDENASALALTFTNKAASEMRERVDKLLGKHADRARLCTFHSFAADLLGQHGSHLGIRPDFQLLAQDEDRIAILEDLVNDLPGGRWGLPPDRKHILNLIDQLFSESYSGEGTSASLGTAPRWLPELFGRYSRALIKANRLDFGSLLYFASRLLRERPAIARVVRLSWTHILVDEFQDTNRAQFELLRLVAPDRRHNLFVVADDDQIIYQWNGASPKRIEDLRRNYKLEIIQLPESYRCPPEIVTHANKLIVHNTRRDDLKKALTSLREPRQTCLSLVRCKALPSPQLEAEFVARDCRDRGLIAANCAVLGRTNRLIRRTAEGIRNAGLDVYVPQKKSEFESPVLNVLVEALRLANFRHDRVVLRRACLAWERLKGRALEPDMVEAAAALAGGDFLRAWIDVAAAAGGNDIVLNCIRADLLDRLRFPEIVDEFLNEGWRSWSGADHVELTEEEVATWDGLHRDIVHERGSHVPLNIYLQQLDLRSMSAPPGTNALRCMTIHQAKGLEFDHVYLIGMAQEVFPYYRAVKAGRRSEQLEEERRSCFVAITRARETLTITRSNTYYGFPKAPSQFLGEMGVMGG